MTPEQSHGLFSEYVNKKDPATGVSLAETLESKEIVALKRGWEAMREHAISMQGLYHCLAYMALEASKRTPAKMVYSVSLEVKEDLTVNIWDPRMTLQDSKNKPIAVMKKRWGQESAKQPVKGYKK